MKKFSKIVLASSIVLGFSVTPELFNATQAQAQESIEPHYNYDGYTAYQSGFILDKNFKESLKSDNFTIKHFMVYLRIKLMVFSSLSMENLLIKIL